jgi:hypothetical protein
MKKSILSLSFSGLFLLAFSGFSQIGTTKTAVSTSAETDTKTGTSTKTGTGASTGTGTGSSTGTGTGTGSGTTGIVEKGTVESVIFYPNPTKGIVYFPSSFENVIADVKVYNTIGQVVYQSTEKIKQVDLSAYPDGVYYIQCLTKDDHSKMILNRIVKATE